MRSLIAKIILKLAVPLLVGVLLIGIFDRAEGWIVCGLFVVWRSLGLLEEWRRAGLPPPDWAQRERDLLEAFRKLKAIGCEDEEADVCLETPMDDAALAHAATVQVERQRAIWVAPRPRGILLAEEVGLVGYALLVPMAVALSQAEFYSFRRNSTGIDMVVILGALVLYGLPHLRRLRGRLNPWLWWGCPAVVAAVVIASQLTGRHAYLNPFHPERRRLAAEKVLQMADNIVAADHADWITNHAEDLARRGAANEAVRLCERALRLAPGNSKAVWILKTLGAPASEVQPSIAQEAPYFASGEVAPKAQRTQLSLELERVHACTMILVPMGEVGPDVLDSVAAVITKELGMPALVYERTLPLPPHTRARGLLGKNQWSYESLIAPLQQEINGRVPQAPLKFLVITPADLYGGGANFAFSVQWDWGAIVATAQFDRAGGPREVLRYRVAKQAVSSVIKTFGVPPSGDRRCVTSYARNLPEFDAKGNRPLPATLAAFESKLREVNEPWQRYQASVR